MSSPATPSPEPAKWVCAQGYPEDSCRLCSDSGPIFGAGHEHCGPAPAPGEAETASGGRRRWCEIEGPHRSHLSPWAGDLCPGEAETAGEVALRHDEWCGDGSKHQSHLWWFDGLGEELRCGGRGYLPTPPPASSGGTGRPGGDEVDAHPRWPDGTPMLLGQLAQASASDADCYPNGTGYDDTGDPIVIGHIIRLDGSEVTIWWGDGPEHDPMGDDCEAILFAHHLTRPARPAAPVSTGGGHGFRAVRDDGHPTWIGLWEGDQGIGGFYCHSAEQADAFTALINTAARPVSTGERPAPSEQVEAWKRALAGARIGWIIDDDEKLWPPHDPHDGIMGQQRAEHPHKYDGGCALCRAGDSAQALDALLHFLAAHPPVPPGGQGRADR